jgi:hypothetical protein
VEVLVIVAVVASYPVTYVQPSPQHGQQTVSPQQYRLLLQQAQPQVGAAVYQQEPQTQSLIYQQQAPPQSQPQVYVAPRPKARPLATQQAGEQAVQETEDYDVSSVYIPGYGLDDREIDVGSPAEAKGFFPLASVSRSALRPTQPPVQWVLGVLSPG